jgi:hypothetical protein
LQIVYQGQTYDFDMADITIKQAIKIEKYLGCPIAEFGDRLSPDGDKQPDMMAIQCLGWLVLHEGRGIPIDEADFSVRGFMTALTDAMKPDQEPEAAPVPTVAEPSANGAVADVPLTVP